MVSDSALDYFAPVLGDGEPSVRGATRFKLETGAAQRAFAQVVLDDCFSSIGLNRLELRTQSGR